MNADLMAAWQSMPHSSLAIANELISRGLEGGTALTHMQIQKLLYLSHGFSLGAGRGSLIEDTFEAWDFGPVVRRLYDALKQHGPKPVIRLIRWGDDTPFVIEREFVEAFEQITPFERELLDYVSHSYSRLHAFQLSSLTHAEGSPWQQSYVEGQNRPITNEIIEQHFRAIVDGAQAA